MVITSREIKVEGFVQSGNKILRNLKVTIGRTDSFLNRALDRLGALYNKEEDPECKYEIWIIVEILGNTFDEGEYFGGRETETLNRAAQAFKEVLKYRQYLSEKEIVEKGLALAGHIIERIQGKESLHMRIIVHKLRELSDV